MTKLLVVSDSLHTRVKLEATRRQMFIRDWVEMVLEAALDEAANTRARVLIDTPATYTVKGEDHA